MGMLTDLAFAELPCPNVTCAQVEKLCEIVLGLCHWAYGYVFYVSLECFNAARQK